MEKNNTQKSNYIKKLCFAILITCGQTVASANALLDQGQGIVDQGRAFLSGDDGILLRQAWNTGDSRAFTIISDRATHGNNTAQNLMGVIFDTGKFGQNKSPERALYWFNRSALDGNLTALYNLGIIYSTGRTPTGRADPYKAAKAFGMVHDTKRGKAIPQVTIWLATWAYNNHNYQTSWDICSEITVGKWLGYADEIKARMLLTKTAPKDEDPVQVTRLLEEATNKQTPGAAALLLSVYQEQNDPVMILVTQMIMARTTNLQSPPGMTQTQFSQAQNQANFWLKNHSAVPEVLDFLNTITGFEAWLP